ncbi:MAG: hypothetical protein WDA75_21660 [Candidatus Latescibacterota bacterium]|jgi:hypothetical protein
MLLRDRLRQVDPLRAWLLERGWLHQRRISEAEGVGRCRSQIALEVK